MTKRELYVGTITGVAGNVIYAIIVGVMEKSDGLIGFLLNILTAKIPLWYFLVVIALSCIIVLIMIQHRKNHLAFLNHTEEEYNGFKFQWVWKYDETTCNYRMADFWPVCPQCGLQLRVELYDSINAYHCTNGHRYDLNRVYNVKKDLVHKIQRDYKEFANMIDFSNL